METLLVATPALPVPVPKQSIEFKLPNYHPYILYGLRLFDRYINQFFRI